MKAARMHEYGKALVLEDVPVPDIQPDEILVQVSACGMCRSDVQLVDEYFRKYVDIPTPITPGHEITGVVHKIGEIVPKSSGFQEGDHVVVAPGWGDGTCRHCQIGNTHLPERALARVRAVRRIRRVHPRPGTVREPDGIQCPKGRVIIRPPRRWPAAAANASSVEPSPQATETVHGPSSAAAAKEPRAKDVEAPSVDDWSAALTAGTTLGTTAVPSAPGLPGVEPPPPPRTSSPGVCRPR